MKKKIIFFIAFFTFILFTFSSENNKFVEPVYASHCPSGFYGSFPDRGSPARGSTASGLCCPRQVEITVVKLGGGLETITTITIAITGTDGRVYCCPPINYIDPPDQRRLVDTVIVNQNGAYCWSTTKIPISAGLPETCTDIAVVFRDKDCQIPATPQIELVTAFIEYEVVTDRETITGIISNDFDLTNVRTFIGLDLIDPITGAKFQEINVKTNVDFAGVGIPVTVNSADFTVTMDIEKNGVKIVNIKGLTDNTNFIRLMDFATQKYLVSETKITHDDIFILLGNIKEGDTVNVIINIKGTVDITFVSGFEDFTKIENYEGTITGLQFIESFVYSIDRQLETSGLPSGSGGQAGLCNPQPNANCIDEIANVISVSQEINNNIFGLSIGLGLIATVGIVIYKKKK